MPRQTINALLAFRAVAQPRSSTRAAARIGVSPSALSHTIRALEERLGLGLLTRTTRSVVPSEAQRHRSAFRRDRSGAHGIERTARQPAGSLRITTSTHAAQAIVWPAVAKLLPVYPDIQIEMSVHSGFIEKAGRALNVRLEGQLIVNEIALALQAALDGLGLAYLPEDYVHADIEAGRVTRALESWCPPFPGYHLYYPTSAPSIARLHAFGGGAALPPLMRAFCRLFTQTGTLIRNVRFTLIRDMPQTSQMRK
jgi:DNA-binding transcriptional LysR family regulator